MVITLFVYIFSLNQQKLPMVEAALCDADSSDPVILSSIIDLYCEKPSLKEQSVYNRLVFL